MLLSFPVTLLSKRTRGHHKTLIACWAGLGAHHVIALANSYMFRVPGAGPDTRRFHYAAAHWEVAHSLHGYTYTRALGALYEVFGESVFLGHQFSIMAFALSLIVFVELIYTLGQERHVFYLVLAFGLLPGPLIHTSLMLREPFQVLFFLLCIYLFVRIRQGENSVATFVSALLAVVAFSTLHNGLAVFAPLFGVAGFLWALGARREVGILFGVALLATAPLLLPKVIAKISEQSVQVERVVEGGGLEYIANYRELGEEGRTGYNISLNLSNPLLAASTVPAVLFAYFFLPMPWQVSSPLDVYAMLEGWLRGALFFGAYVYYKRGERLPEWAFVFLSGLALEAMWGIGTFNWGQGLRHHVVAGGVFLLAGGGGLLDYHVARKRRDILSRRRANRAKPTVQQE